MSEKFERIRFHKTRSLAGAIYSLVVASVLTVSGVLTAVALLYLNKAGLLHRITPKVVIVYLLFLVIFLGAILLFARRVIRVRILEPIRIISETAEAYAKDKSDGTIDDFYFGHMQLLSGDEFQELSSILAGMEQDIADSDQRLMKVTAEQERMNTELSVANSIQENMLPNLFPPFPGRSEFDIFATMEPAKEVGGDFFDFFLLDDTHLGLVMADVSGKGIPAALFMMSSMIIIDNYASLGYSPSRVLELSNRTICGMELVDMFVTVWFGILDLNTGLVTASNAGHEYPAICQSDGSFALMKAKHDFVVGGLEGMSYSEYSFTLKKGASLFLYTGGVPEAASKNNELYGTERMLNALNAAKDLTPHELLRSVRADISEFVGTAPQFDDLTMMCIRYNGPA